MFLSKLCMKKDVVMTVPRKQVRIIIPYLGNYSLSLKKNLRKVFTKILPMCKLDVIFKTSNRISHYFHFKDRCPSVLRSSVIYKYTCGNCNVSYIGKSFRHFIVRSSEHLGLSARTGKPVKGMEITPVREHSLFCNTKPCLDDFEIIGTQLDGNNYLLELKESIFLYKLGPQLNKDTTSKPLYLFV